VVLLKPLSLIGGDPLSQIVVEEVRAKPLSHVGDGGARTMLVMARCQSRVNLAMVQCRCRLMLVTTLSSPAGDGAAEMTWL
jgi:hypothetical protein